VKLQVVADPAAAVAERLAAAAAAGAQLVLTGGSTPRLAYERAAQAGVDWSRASLWWGDERCVPPDDERSNYGMAQAALLDRLGDRGRPEVHRIPGELGPEEGARRYEQELRRVLGDEPAFDLVLMGLGPDGHTASLFPHAPTLHERERLVVGAEPGLEPWVDRVTMTLPVFDRAREMIFLVAGSGKEDALRRVLSGERDPGTPASLVSPPGEPVLICDAAALPADLRP
jgi:6-phosphogluconolactonase